MHEYVTRAVVLEKEPLGDFDSLLTLYTRDLGKVKAKAKSLRKITSRLAAHVEPGWLAHIRLTGKNPLARPERRFWLTDSLAERKLFADYSFLELVSGMTEEYHPDPDLWRFLLAGRAERADLLKLLGFGGREMPCGRCAGGEAAYFYGSAQVFLCGVCSGRFPERLLLRI